MHRRRISSAQVAIFILFTILVFLFTYPSILHLNSIVVGDGGDNLEYFSYIHLVKHNIQQQKPPFAHVNLYRYPVGFDLNIGSDAHLFTFLGGIASLHLPSRFVFNALILTIMVVNGVVTYHFFKYITKHTLTSIACSIIYAYSYYAISRAAGYVNILQMYGYPLLAMAIAKIIKKNTFSFKNSFIFWGAIILLAFSSLQHLIIAVTALLFFVVFSFAFYYQKVVKNINIWLKSIWIFLSGGVLCLLLLLLSFFPWFKSFLIQHPHQLTQIEENRRLFTPFLAYIIPSPQVSTFLTHIFYDLVNGDLYEKFFHIELSVFYGYVEISLFVISVILLRKTKKNILLLLLFGLFFLLSLKLRPDGLFSIFYIIQNTFPFKSVSRPQRFFVIHNFLFTIFLSNLLIIIEKKSKYLIYFIVFLLILERVPTTFYSSNAVKQPYHEAASNIGSGAVLDIPIILGSSYIFERYNMEPFFYSRPIVDGYIYRAAEFVGARDFFKKNPILSNFFCGDDNTNNMTFYKMYQLISLLRTSNINTIVLHKNYIMYEQCHTVKTITESYFTDYFLNKQYEDQQAIVYTLK